MPSYAQIAKKLNEKKKMWASLMTVLLNMNFLCMATKNAFVAH